MQPALPTKNASSNTMDSTLSSRFRRRQNSMTCGREHRATVHNSLKKQQGHETLKSVGKIMDQEFNKWTNILRQKQHTGFPPAVRKEAESNLDLAKGLLTFDEKSRSYNRRMNIRKMLFVFIGVLCLVVPALLLFDLLLSVFYYAELVEILNYASQESSTIGSIAYVCVNVLNIASFLRRKNESYNGAVAWGCLSMLLSLLCLIRYTTKLKPVLSKEARSKVVRLRNLITEALCVREGHSTQTGN